MWKKDPHCVFQYIQYVCVRVRVCVRVCVCVRVRVCVLE